MNRPTFLDRHPRAGPVFVFLAWVFVGVLDAIGY